MSEVDAVTEALLVAHGRVSEEIGDGRAEMEDTEWADGHRNGLHEARNRIEETILDYVDSEEIPNVDSVAVEHADS